MFLKKSQSSLEFLMIFGIGFLIILGLTSIFITYFNGEKNTLDKKHMENIGDSIIDNVEKIYFLGKGNRITMDTKFSEGISNLTIEHMNVSDPSGAPGDRLYFDLLKIEFYTDEGVGSQVFETNELYVRFNCTKCYQTPRVNGSWISYFNYSDYNPGFKKIRFESFGDWVSMDFVK